MDLVEAVLSGNRLALARAISHVENGDGEGKHVLDGLFPHTGRAHLVGITGAPGTGKSSLANQMTRLYRQPKDGGQALKVGVIAVDPSSPFTGGAVLGDRVRMRDVAGDDGVFIRSMATRGALGGLAHTTSAVAQVLDAAGFDIILIETVGAGQSEVDIARLAHTTLVVEAPGFGDDIQAIKAGILEIADILVVNKADLEGVEVVERALRAILDLAPPENQSQWKTPVLRTVATRGDGFENLVNVIRQHGEYLRQSGAWQQREQTRLRAELDNLLQVEMMNRWRTRVSTKTYQEVIDRLYRRQLSPSQAAAVLLDS